MDKLSEDSSAIAQEPKPGPHKKLWAARTWIHKATGAEMTIEADHPRVCKVLFTMSVSNTSEWREKK